MTGLGQGQRWDKVYDGARPVLDEANCELWPGLDKANSAPWLALRKVNHEQSPELDKASGQRIAGLG